MDRRQRFADPVEQFRSAFEGMQSEVWTTLPGVIDSVDFDALTCSVQPAVMAQVTALDGSKSWVELPLLLDCPIQFPCGGGFTLTFPVEQGDECLIVFSSRCIDNWFAQAGETGPSGLARSQAELRMHDLSDGFVIPGIRNKARASSLEASPTDVQLRTDAGTAVISIRANSEIYAHSDVNIIIDTDADIHLQAAGDVNVVAGGDVTVNATNLTANCENANVFATATALLKAPVITATATTAATVSAPVINLVGAVDITGSFSLNGIPFGLSHVHSGVATGTHNTGPVV